MKRKAFFQSIQKLRLPFLLSVICSSYFFLFTIAWKEDPGAPKAINQTKSLNHSFLSDKAPMKIWCLRMDKAVVEDFLSSGGWNHKMILRFSMTGLSAVNGNLDVYAYWTKNQKQKESRKTVVLKTDTASVNLDSQKEYVLGNNYLRMKILKKYIKEIRKVKDFEYLRFTPIENSGQIAFSVQAIGSDGKVISLPKSNNITNGECITNPSPPAKPDGLMQ